MRGFWIVNPRGLCIQMVAFCGRGSDIEKLRLVDMRGQLRTATLQGKGGEILAVLQVWQ